MSRSTIKVSVLSVQLGHDTADFETANGCYAGCSGKL